MHISLATLSCCWSGIRNTYLAISIITLVTGLAAYAYPAEAVCAVAGEKNKLSNTQKLLLHKAKDSISTKFGSMQSKPVIVFFREHDSFRPLRLNVYGSTSFVGSKTCVFIGPQGPNIDVVAHELMHAETKYRVGYWRRWLELPIWFDEGLAMQVDYREWYNLPQGTETSYVRQLKSVSDFAVSDSELLTNHYASAKSEVAAWVASAGENSVYNQLNRLKEGVSFDTVWLSVQTARTKPSSKHSC